MPTILSRLARPVNAVARFAIAHERAWFAGLSLAVDTIEAEAPEGYTAAERAAFAAGQVAGFREIDLDRLEWCEAYDRRTEELRDRYGDDEARGTIVGHHADAEGGLS